MSITGSNNPFACEPVVFANANSIVSLGTITRDGNQFTFSVGFVWKINGVTYQNTTPVVITIAEASTGFQRIDNALLNTSNTIELQQGLESDTIALRPTFPDNNILLTSWNILGDAIEDTETPIVGAQFKQKNESRKFSTVLSGTDQVIEFRAAGHQHYEISGTVTSVAGFGKTLLLASPSAEIPYAGKDIFFENNSGHNITLKNNFSGVDVKFDLGTDLVVPANGIVWLKYDATAENLALFFKSWTDLSGAQFKKKLESAGYADSILTGANAVIPLQPNGQGAYSFSNAGLTSIDGFGLNLITGNPNAESPYPGKDILIFNNKATNLILKHDGSGTADVKFLLEGSVDLVIPAGGKVWLKYGPSYCEFIFKSWTDLSHKADLVGGKVPASQLPSYVDDILEFADLASFPATGESGKIYVALDANYTYRWSGSAYVKISDNEKLDKSTTPSSVYVTNTAGGQTMIPLSELVGNQIQQITPVTLLSGGWSLVSGLYQYNYSNVNITTTTIVDVIPDNSTIEIVKTAEILPQTNSSNGSVRLFSKNLPTSNIVVTLNIFN